MRIRGGHRSSNSLSTGKEKLKRSGAKKEWTRRPKVRDLSKGWLSDLGIRGQEAGTINIGENRREVKDLRKSGVGEGTSTEGDKRKIASLVQTGGGNR